MEYVTEYRLHIDYGGRDGIVGHEDRLLGRVSRAKAYEYARELLREHAVRVEISWRQVEAEWTHHATLGVDDVRDEVAAMREP